MNKEKKYCIGCGVLLQDENMMQEGYTTSIENDICNRCFRMRNYGEYQIITKSNEEYIDILKSVNKTNDLVLYMVDLLNVDKDLNYIRQYIKNKIILVLNKRDVLPKSVKDEKIINYFKDMDLDFQDVIVVSPNKNYNIDELLLMIKKYKTSKNVYVVGHTNVGKSTLINKLMKNYSFNNCFLTMSPLPSTTLNKISIKLSDDLTLIDTPGLVDRGNIVNYVDSSLLKKINPKKEIKPKTYQLKKGQALVIGGLVRIDYLEGNKNSFTVFMSNDLKVERFNMNNNEKLKDLYPKEFDVLFHEDIVISGLGFIKVVEKAKVTVYADKNVLIYTRKSLI